MKWFNRFNLTISTITLVLVVWEMIKENGIGGIMIAITDLPFVLLYLLITMLLIKHQFKKDNLKPVKFDTVEIILLVFEIPLMTFILYNLGQVIFKY